LRIEEDNVRSELICCVAALLSGRMSTSDGIYDKLQDAYASSREMLKHLFDERLNGLEGIDAARARGVEMMDLIDECNCLFNDSDYSKPHLALLMKAAGSVQ
jgi:hypothetical protein